MRKSLLEALVCPRSGRGMDVEVLADDGVDGAPDVRFGVLSGPAGEYPIVEGIPVFQPTGENVVGLLRSRRFDDATAAAVLGQLPRNRRSRLLALGVGTAVVGRAAGAVRAADERRLERRTKRAILEDGRLRGPAEILRFGYLDSAGASAEAFNYFRFRYSMPRYPVALSCIEAALPSPGPIVDVGCGAGHLTWALQQRAGTTPVVGVERELFLLLVARQLAPSAAFVCADAAALPFRTGWAARAFAFDVLSFVTQKWAVVREIDRVLGPGGRMAFTSVKNARRPHVHAGEPLTPDGWRSLVGDRPHRLIPDRVVLDRYLDGVGCPAAGECASTEIDGAPTLTLLATKGIDDFVDAGPFDGWPHARGPLSVNPLYAPVRGPDDELAYELRFPSEAFAADSPDLRRYLPQRFRVDDLTLRAAATGEIAEELELLVARQAVLTLPAAMPGSGWSPSFGGQDRSEKAPPHPDGPPSTIPAGRRTG